MRALSARHLLGTRHLFTRTLIPSKDVFPEPQTSEVSAQSNPPQVGWSQINNIIGDAGKSATTPFTNSSAVDISTPESRWMKQSRTYNSMNVWPNTPYSGRSMEVVRAKSKDLISIWQKLHRVLRASNAKLETLDGQRYEKPGDKRRRLRSQRWRRRFSEEVRRKVRLVNEIKWRGA